MPLDVKKSYKSPNIKKKKDRALTKNTNAKLRVSFGADTVTPENKKKNRTLRAHFAASIFQRHNWIVRAAKMQSRIVL